MADQYVLGSVLASVLALVVLYNLFVKRNARGESTADVAKAATTAVTGECRSKNGGGDDVDVIIVGAGVAGAALAHTLGKV